MHGADALIGLILKSEVPDIELQPGEAVSIAACMM